MDNLGNEVILKVKEAIRAKLKEMKANSSSEIIDYIMLLVTTKKSSVELAKSIDFVMEDNTAVFVKWLSTIIKKLQQVTVTTAEKQISGNEQVSKVNILTNKKDQSHDIIKCEDDDVKLENSNEEKEDFMLNLSVDEDIIQSFDGEKNNFLPESNLPKSTKCDKNKISTDNVRRNILSSSAKDGRIKNDTLKNRVNANKISFNEMENTSSKNDLKVKLDSSSELKKDISDKSDKVECKKKRPRISINNDDKDQKNVEVKLSLSVNEKPKQIPKELPQKNNKHFMSQVVVAKSANSKKDVNETKKKLYMHDLIVQRVDHQRGALALDTAFKYIQQQIGASNDEIIVFKKWRDYAVEMLRSSKK